MIRMMLHYMMSTILTGLVSHACRQQYYEQMHAFIRILVTTVRPSMCVVSVALRQVLHHGLVCHFHSAVFAVVAEAAREVTPLPTALLLVLPLALRAKA